MGAKSLNSKPVPEELQPLLDKLNFGQGYSYNQILVNKYSGPESSLPQHSDNEYDINPLSDIVTVSIGDSASVIFTEKHQNTESKLDVNHRSMYSMTRSSQNFYSHHIAANTSNTVRYSITVRCIHWTYPNSLYAIGDSNFDHIQFGDDKSKLGNPHLVKRNSLHALKI